jgi:acetyltransferase-like isoleucine patch superfamily enzyme
MWSESLNMSDHSASKLHRWTEGIIRVLKRDASYQLDRHIAVEDLVAVLWQRGLSVLRGYLVRWQLGEVRGLLFLGKNISLRHKRRISLGRSVIIENDVFIDALSQNGVELGNNVTVAKFSTLQCTGVIQELGVGIDVGDNSAIGAYSFLGGQGGIRIGKNVIMGPKVNIFSEDHGFDDLEKPIRLQPTRRQGVMIDDNCWIGANSTIVDGVHIHSGCVIAAGSVVTKDVPANSIAGGVPAKVIRARG